MFLIPTTTRLAIRQDMGWERTTAGDAHSIRLGFTALGAGVDESETAFATVGVIGVGGVVGGTTLSPTTPEFTEAKAGGVMVGDTAPTKTRTTSIAMSIAIGTANVEADFDKVFGTVMSDISRKEGSIHRSGVRTRDL